jgi:hypothetical protein
MFHLVPISGGGRKQRPEQWTLAFMGQFLIVAIVILLFVIYVSGLQVS